MAQSLELATRGRRNGSARGALKSRAHDVLEDFAGLRQDMSKLADAASKAARAEVKQAGKKLETIGRDLRGRATSSADMLVEQVRARPVAAIGATLGAGLLLGLLLRGRR